MLKQDIETFIAVVEEGSFTDAGLRLNQSKSRVSQLISTLENNLSCSLFVRSTRKVHVTEIGKTYYAECKHAYNILNKAEKNIHEKQNELSGTIRLNSVGGIFAQKKLSPAIIAFLKLYPNIDIELSLGSQQVNLLAENYDLVIRMGTLEDSGLIARHLMSIETHIVTSPQYLKAPLSSPKALADHNCLAGSVKNWQLKHLSNNEYMNVTINGNLHIADGHILCEAALAGAGIVRLNALYTQRYLETKALMHVFNDWEVPKTNISLLYPQVRYRTKRIQHLVEFLVNWFRENKAAH